MPIPGFSADTGSHQTNVVNTQPTHLNLNTCFEKVAKHNKIHTYVNNVLLFLP